MSQLNTTSPGVVLDTNSAHLHLDEATHTYTMNVWQEEPYTLPSVSSFIKDFHKFFDAPAVAYMISQKSDKSVEDILAEWDATRDAAIERGNKTHDFAQYWCDFDYDRPANPTTYQELGVVEFMMNLPEHLVPLRTEQKLWSREYQYAGTTDLILLNRETNKLIIVDWKTNKDLHKNYRDLLYYPFDEYVNCPLHKYYIQLSFYQIMVEETGLEVEDRWIIHLPGSPDIDGGGDGLLYTTYKAPDLTDKIHAHFKETSGKSWRDNQNET